MNISGNPPSSPTGIPESVKYDLQNNQYYFGRTIKRLVAAPMLVMPGEWAYDTSWDGTGGVKFLSALGWTGISLIANYLTLGYPVGYVIVGAGIYCIVANKLAADVTLGDMILDKQRSRFLDKLDSCTSLNRYNDGYDQGYEKGRKDGYSKGHQQGYNKGCQDGSRSNYIASQNLKISESEALEFLGFEKLPSEAEINRQYKKMILHVHPDRRQQLSKAEIASFDALTKVLNLSKEQLLKLPRR